MGADSEIKRLADPQAARSLRVLARHLAMKVLGIMRRNYPSSFRSHHGAYRLIFQRSDELETDFFEEAVRQRTICRALRVSRSQGAQVWPWPGKTVRLGEHHP